MTPIGARASHCYVPHLQQNSRLLFKMVCSDKTYIDPKEFYNPNSPRPPKSIIGQYWYVACGAASGVLAAVFYNIGFHRPYFAGLQRHALYAGIGGIIGQYMTKVIRNRAAERDYFYYHYMLDHADDFPIIERKKYADVFESWTPRR